MGPTPPVDAKARACGAAGRGGEGRGGPANAKRKSDTRKSETLPGGLGYLAESRALAGACGLPACVCVCVCVVVCRWI